MAPNAPMGAARIRMATSLNTGEASACRKAVTGRPRSPTMASEMPNNTATNSTCRMSPDTNGLTIVLGMMFSRKPVMVESCALLT